MPAVGERQSGLPSPEESSLQFYLTSRGGNHTFIREQEQWKGKAQRLAPGEPPQSETRCQNEGDRAEPEASWSREGATILRCKGKELPAGVIAAEAGKEGAWTHLASHQPATGRYRGRARLLATQQLPGLQGTVQDKNPGSSEDIYSSANGEESNTKRN